MTTKTLLPLFIIAALAMLLVVGLTIDGRSASADDFVFQKCPTPTPGTPTPTNTPGGPTKTSTATSTPCSVKLTSTPTVTPTPPPGAAMSLRVDAAQTFPCAGGPVAGKVCVHLNRKFDVVVVADAIPVSGYIAAIAWVHYDSQGLVDKKNTAALWPDCDPPTFFTIQDAGVNGAFAACTTSLLPPQPPSFHNGDLYSFSLTCTNSASTNNIQLLPQGDPVAGTEGALFIEHTTGNQIVPSVGGITVNCAAKPPKLPHPGDSDGDGCSDQQENGPDETLGGQRDYLNPHDFYDVAGDPNPPQNGAPDGVVDLPNDILGVILHHPAGPMGYDVQFDRGTWTGPNSWNDTQGPDGVIDLPNDILGVIEQFNHSCQ